MSFIYRAPLNLSVSGRIAYDRLQFRSSPQLLVKFRDSRPHDCDDVKKEARELPGAVKAGRAPMLPVESVWRSDGRTKLDPKWWRVFDLGPLDRPHGKHHHVRLARFEFHGEEFSKINDNSCPSPEDLALYDAFLEQDTILVQVRMPTEAFVPDPTLKKLREESKRDPKSLVCLGSHYVKLDYR